MQDDDDVDDGVLIGYSLPEMPEILVRREALVMQYSREEKSP